MLVTCPSGLSFQARRWKIGDRKNLHDRKLLRQGLLMRKMLEAIDEGLESPGPYEFAPGKKISWSDVCFSDIIDALVDVRIATKPVLDYDENCAQCGAKIPLSIDLQNLSRVPMSAEGKQYLSTGEPVVKEIATGETNADGSSETMSIKLQMFFGKDLTRLANLYKQDPKSMINVQMAMHIASVETGNGAPITEFRKVLEWYQDQSWDFHNNLDDEVASFTGGVHTLVSMDCEQCNAEQEAALPFGAEFYYPKKKRPVSSMATF